jgi:N-acetylmuramoyl-L-alanine amidase
MASAIYRAFKDFKEKENPSAKPPVDTPVKVPEIKPEKKETKQTESSTATVGAKTQVTSAENKPKSSDAVAKTEVKTEAKTEVKPKVETPKAETKPANTKTDANPTGLVINKPSDVPSKNISKGVKFQIQILTSAKSLKPDAPEFKGIKNVEEYVHNGIYKYLSGTTDSYAEAKVIRDKVIEFGFKDAFIVAFEDNQRIDLAKAVTLIQKK